MDNNKLKKNTNNRPTWDEVWMNMAKIISLRSYNPRHQVGAVVVTKDNSQVLAVGYNGNYAGGPNEVESEEPGQCGMIHAEINALLKLDYNNPKNKIMYLTLSPCKHCAKCIVNAGINEIVYLEQYRDDRGLNILKNAGIKIKKYNINI
jgi:dCMP deaminase